MSYVLGLTGGFGSGKSTVARLLAEIGGAVVIDADVLAREALAPQSPILTDVAREFGPDLVDAEGTLNRRELARRAFANHAQALRLNALIHPWVRARECELIARHAATPLIVCDVPLLLETGLQALCNAVVVVTCSEAQRFYRLRQRGFSEADVMRRLAFQMPQARKLTLADHVIDNSGTLEATRTQIETLLGQLHGQIHGDNPTAS